MKVSPEFKKITVSENLQSTTCIVEFVMDGYKDLDLFKKKVIDFTKDCEGQTRLA